MNTIEPAPGKYPLPEMKQHNLRHYHSDAVDRVALLAVKQGMAGMLSTPLGVKLVERHVTCRFLAGQEQVEFRFIFQLELNEKSTPYTSWLVVVPTDDAHNVTGKVTEVTEMRPAEVYEWDAEKGWQKLLEFLHPYVKAEFRRPFGPEEHDPFDWPAA